MATYQLGRKLLAASGVVEAHLGAGGGLPVVLSRLAVPWANDAAFLERFSAMRALVDDVGVAGDAVWFAQRTGDGETLRALMASQAASLELNQIVAIVERVAQKLAALHESGQVHGDVSASSVFITTQGGVLLLHPGVAVSAGSHPARGPARSEPHAIAPEQIVAPPSAAADVFRLGLLLLELLTGKSVFVASDPQQGLLLAQKFQSVPESTLAGVPSQLSSLVLSMLSRDPTARPPAAEVPDAIGMASASLDLSTGDAEVARAFRRQCPQRPPAGPFTELVLTAPTFAPKRPKPMTPPPGSVLGRIGMRRVTHEQLEAVRSEEQQARAASTSPSMREAMVGELWLKSGRLTASALSEVQQRSVLLGLSLTETALLDGVVTEDEAVTAMGSVTGTPVALERELHALTTSCTSLGWLTATDARRLNALPLAERNGLAVVAVGDPLDVTTAETLKTLVGRPVQLVRSNERALRETIDRLYPARKLRR